MTQTLRETVSFDEHMLNFSNYRGVVANVSLCPIDTVCGDVLNMAMCLNVCLIVLQIEVARDQFYMIACKSLFG